MFITLDSFRCNVKKFSDLICSLFLHIEDYILIRKVNVSYWLRSLLRLKPFGLIPSFVQFVYKNESSIKFAPNFVNPIIFNEVPKNHITK